MSEKMIKLLYRTYGDRGYREDRELSKLPESRDEVVFEDGIIYRVSGRTFLTNVLTGETICDIYLDKPYTTGGKNGTI